MLEITFLIGKICKMKEKRLRDGLASLQINRKNNQQK